jgi:DNA-directed RNA polymerase subunit alpha
LVRLIGSECRYVIFAFSKSKRTAALDDNFTTILRLEGKPMATTRIPLSVEDEKAKDIEHKLGLSTAEIGLTVRTTNCLEERGIFTVEQLLQHTPAELLSIANFGEKTLEEVYRSLEEIGFYRRGFEPKPR